MFPVPTFLAGRVTLSSRIIRSFLAHKSFFFVLSGLGAHRIRDRALFLALSLRFQREKSSSQRTTRGRRQRRRNGDEHAVGGVGIGAEFGVLVGGDGMSYEHPVPLGTFRTIPLIRISHPTECRTHRFRCPKVSISSCWYPRQIFITYEITNVRTHLIHDVEPNTLECTLPWVSRMSGTSILETHLRPSHLQTFC